MSDLGNQHNNGPHQDQITLCFLLGIVGQKSTPGMGGGGGGGGMGGGTDDGGGGWGGGTDAPNRLFTKGVRLSVSPGFFSASDVLCLRSSGSKYDASAINYLLLSFFLFFSLFFSSSFLHFDLKLFRTF